MTEQDADEALDALLHGAARARPEPSAACVTPGQISILELIAVYEGGLDEARHAAVQLHLSACPHCRALQLDLLKHAESEHTSKPSRRGRAVMLALAATVLATAVGVQALQHPATPPEPVSWPMRLTGNVAELRGEPSQTGLKRFVADSRVDFSVRPPSSPQVDPPMVMRGYRLDAEDVLQALSVDVERVTNPQGEPTFRVQAPASAIFDSRPGPQTIVWALGTSTKAVSGLTGTAWRNAPGAPEVTWVRWQAIYEP